MSEVWLYIYFEPEIGTRASRLPKWKRLIMIHESDGDIFVPAAYAPCGEQIAFLSACFDGASFVEEQKHAFLSLAWMQKEYPSEDELWKTIRRRAAEGWSDEQRNPNLLDRLDS